MGRQKSSERLALAVIIKGALADKSGKIPRGYAARAPLHATLLSVRPTWADANLWQLAFTDVTGTGIRDFFRKPKSMTKTKAVKTAAKRAVNKRSVKKGKR